MAKRLTGALLLFLIAISSGCAGKIDKKQPIEPATRAELPQEIIPPQETFDTLLSVSEVYADTAAANAAFRYRWDDVIRILNAKQPLTKPERFLLGTAYLKQNQKNEAIAAFGPLFGDTSFALYPYAVLNLADAYAPDSLDAAFEVLETPLPEDFRDEVLVLRFELASEADEYKIAIEALDSLLAEYPGYYSKTRQEYIKGDLFLGIGDTVAAKTSFRYVIENSRSSLVLSAASRLDRLGILSGRDLYRAGKVAIDKQKWDVAEDYLKRYLETGEKHKRGEAEYYYARALSRQGRYSVAISIYKKIVKEKIYNSAWANLGIAYCYRKMGTFSKAKDHLNLAINQGAGTNAEAEALWEGVELSEDMGNYEEAGDYGRKLSRKFPSHELGDNGSVWSGIGAYINGDFAVAAERFDYIPTKYSDPTFTDLGRYWRGVSLIADGDTMGRVILRNVADSPVRHYYKYLSAEELSGKPLPDPAISTSGEWISYQDAIDIAWELLGEMGSPRPFLIIDNPHAKSAEILARLGLIADAESEFEKWINEVGMSETYRLAFLETAYEWGLTGMAYKLSLRLVGDFSGWMEAPVEIIRLSYPTFYEQQVRASARVQAIDPAILYAIMRRESAFRPHVVSYAGAVGLCQFMPFTGKAVSHELGEPEFSENHLYSWDVSIRFGAHYLASLLRKHQLPEYALAEYNAGPGPTERWKKVAHDNNRAVFVEAVDFFQTRHYIKNVLGDYYAYKELWDGMVFE